MAIFPMALRTSQVFQQLVHELAFHKYIFKKLFTLLTISFNSEDFTQNIIIYYLDLGTSICLNYYRKKNWFFFVKTLLTFISLQPKHFIKVILFPKTSIKIQLEIHYNHLQLTCIALLDCLEALNLQVQSLQHIYGTKRERHWLRRRRRDLSCDPILNAKCDNYVDIYMLDIELISFHGKNLMLMLRLFSQRKKISITLALDEIDYFINNMKSVGL
ncbi:hypothetical protein ACJX0J_025711, partial [Zea mays]